MKLQSGGTRASRGGPWTSILSTFTLLTVLAGLLMLGGTRELGPVNLVAAVDITDLPGTVSDQYSTAGAEGIDKIIDNTPYTKYFTFNSTSWVQFVADNAAVVTSYTVTSANDSADRDPKSWVFEASTTGTSWTTLNTQTNQTFVARYAKKTYSFSNAASYRYYRLRTTANNGGSYFQIAELQIFGTTTGSVPAPAAPTGIVATAVADEQVQVTWADNTRYETGYGLERKVGSGSWTLVKNLPIGTTRYYDVGRSGSTSYTYRVRALGTTNSAYATSSAVTTPSSTPPTTYMETYHTVIGGGDELLTLVSATTDVVIYRDPQVPTNLTWTVTKIQQIYAHVRASYPALQGQRLWVTLHNDPGPGGTAQVFGNQYTKYHNVIDIYDADWSTPSDIKLDVIAHEIGHIIEFAGYGTLDSPAYFLWHDSKWCEIFQYWAYVGAGLSSDATRWYNDKSTDPVDGYPAATTDWFTQWFYPISNNYSGATTLNKYFQLLSQHYHQFNGWYPTSMTMGEFVHFWSGATGANQQTRAQTAFGWNSTWQAELDQAKLDFPGVTYTP